MILNNFTRKLLLFGTPVVLVGAGLSTMAEPTTAAEAAAEANEPALPGGGHADAADANVDYQFDGIQ